MGTSTEVEARKPRLRRQPDGTLRRVRTKTEKQKRRWKRERRKLQDLIGDKNVRRHLQYRPSFADTAKTLCGVYGSTKKELAKFFGVSEVTIHVWLKRFPAFGEAVREGTAIASMKVTVCLYQSAIGFSVPTEKIFYDSRCHEFVRAKTREYYPPSTTAQIFWLKNRMPNEWKDVGQLKAMRARSRR
jgi:hypothetical protein